MVDECWVHDAMSATVSGIIQQISKEEWFFRPKPHPIISRARVVYLIKMDAIADVVADAVRRSISDMSSSSVQAFGSRSRSLEPQNVSLQSSATDSLADMTSYQSRRSGQSSSQSEQRLLKGTFSIMLYLGSWYHVLWHSKSGLNMAWAADQVPHIVFPKFSVPL